MVIHVIQRLLCSVLLALTLQLSVYSQGTAAQQFAAADWFSRPLGVGVIWKYYQFDNLYGGPQSISYIEADLDTPGVRIELPYLNGVQRTTNMIKAQFPTAAAGVNATFFSGGGHMTYLKVNNAVVPQDAPWAGAWGYNGGLVFNRTTGAYNIITQPSNTPSGNQWWAANTSAWTDVLVNGPLLLFNGAIASSQFPTGSHCDRHPRTMVGIKPGNILVLVVVDGRHPGEAIGVTCTEMAEIMLALGCTRATSLDGGGSSAMYGRGEPNNGLISYPSTNGGYDTDTNDERAVANAIAVMANNTQAQQWDARLESLSVPSSMVSGQRILVTATYRNIGTQAWTSDRVSLRTCRPFGSTGRFYDSASWSGTSEPWRLPANAVVQPNGLVAAQFYINAPAVPGPESITEYFQLTRDNTTRFGPADNKFKLKIQVNPNSGTFLVEPRSGGQNTQWYSDNGFADSGIDCALGTPGIGMRYGSTYRSVAGAKMAAWKPTFPARGFYRVYAAWGAAGSRRSPITYHVIHRGGKTTVNLSQAVTADQWVMIGDKEFEFDAGATGQGLEMNNENIDVSGSMYAGPVSFQFIGTSSINDWSLY